ncbi:MAG: ThuA domain-containing protein [Acidobacteriia bacterium]|nr:ThuA domain-containing protein [Terriglobia bacterium]MYK08366.1 ThuA domain-containing protein [Terriglobia bacterium]
MFAASLVAACLLSCSSPAPPSKYAALIVDGQSNHRIWPTTSQYLKTYLEETGMFTVDIATTPPAGEPLEAYRPAFGDYDLVVSNYNGEPWGEGAMADFEAFVGGGGAFVSVHAANNAFPEWTAYNEMIGIGGWGDRTERHGPYVRLREGEFVRDHTPGIGGSHGVRHEFQIDIRDSDHPITSGLPLKWMHANDELYDRLRGPAKNLHVLATAYSTVESEGTGEHEPILMTIRYGEGRIFHTTLGHALISQRCNGFITTFKRGAEWAVTGEVTQALPDEFPTVDTVSVRPEPQ